MAEVPGVGFQCAFIDHYDAPDALLREGQFQRYRWAGRGLVEGQDRRPGRQGQQEGLVGLSGQQVEQRRPRLGPLHKGLDRRREALREDAGLEAADELRADLVDGHQHVAGGPEHLQRSAEALEVSDGGGEQPRVAVGVEAHGADAAVGDGDDDLDHRIAA
jgi:hypothetical protein